MHFKPPRYQRLQGAADAGRRARKRNFELQAPDKKQMRCPVNAYVHSIVFVCYYFSTFADEAVKISFPPSEVTFPFIKAI